MIAGGALRRDGMLMHMDAPRRRLRDLGFWAFGVVTAIAVNLVSDHATAALGVIVAGLAFGAVLLAADQLRRTPESSALRAYARPVAITLAAPLVLMSIIGAGGYLVFVAAAVVAVGLSGETDLRTALITVFALTGIAGSASALHRLGSLLLHPAAQSDGPGERCCGKPVANFAASG